VHLFLAFFWVAVAIVLQIFWETLQRHAFIPVHRNVVSVFCFVLFSYNFIRWRMERSQRQVDQDATELPPKPRVVHREYDPTFDFSKPDAEKPKDDEKKDPPPGG
jgi:hypothetical protein